MAQVIRDDVPVKRAAAEIRAWCVKHTKPLIPASDEGVLFFAEQVVWIATHLDESEWGCPNPKQFKAFSDWLQGKEDANEKTSQRK